MMAGLTRETRLQLMLDERELQAIDDWRFKQHMPSRAAAIRRLIRIGLQNEERHAEDRTRRSQDFDVVSDEDKSPS